MPDDKKTTIHISFNPADNDMDKAILNYLDDNKKRYPLPKAARLKFLFHEMILNSQDAKTYISDISESDTNNIENKLNIANEKLDTIIAKLQSNDFDKDSMRKKQNDFLSGLSDNE